MAELAKRIRPRGTGVKISSTHKKAIKALELHDAISALYSQIKPSRIGLLVLSGFLEEYGIVHWDKQARRHLLRRLRRLRHGGDYLRKFRGGREYLRVPRHQGEYDIFTEARAFFDELVWILANAAVERVNFVGSESAIRCGLRRAQTHPREVMVSPERFLPAVLTLIANNYRHGDEPAGFRGFDVFESAHRRRPTHSEVLVFRQNADQVQEPGRPVPINPRAEARAFIPQPLIACEISRAAERGFREFTKSSRKQPIMTEQTGSLAEELRRWLMQNGDKPKRPYDDEESSSAASLLDIVLGPLNSIVQKHAGRPFSRGWLLKLICKKAD